MMNRQTLLNDLAWQIEAGADEVVGETPGLLHWTSIEKNKESAQDKGVRGLDLAPLVAIKPASPPPLKSEGKVPPVSVMASSLDELREELLRFEGCELKRTAMNLVFADGNPDADIMLIGDAPAEDEDRLGRPFAGKAGQLLDKMLASIGLDRQTVYLSNLVYWRPPGNRTPSEVEIAACLPFVQQHIRLKAPKIIVFCGALPLKHLLRTKDTLSKRRGKWMDYTPPMAEEGIGPIPCLPMYHPAYLMRQPAAKRLAWADLLIIRKKLTKLSD
jgi:DNA polymerase